MNLEHFGGVIWRFWDARVSAGQRPRFNKDKIKCDDIVIWDGTYTEKQANEYIKDSKL